MNSVLPVLVIEDNKGDILLIKKIFSESEYTYKLEVMEDGDKAIRYLKTMDINGIYKPQMIILDLNLPIIDGREVLKTIKTDENLKDIPVIIFSSSSDSEDIEQAYKNYANSYVVKPVNYKDYTSAIRSIESFWLNTAKLPNLANDKV